ncbi:MAG: DMT family transporter [Hyphomicrobiales bacterium]|nr:MAG: DMT family transporter [Hyphomicrobiales bacterium]
MTAASLKNEAASLRGIAMGAAAYSTFAIHDVLVKGVIFDLAVAQILFVRSLVIVIGCLVATRGRVVGDLQRSSSKGLIVLRAALMLGAWCLYYAMGKYLQLAEMTTLYYVAPIITLVLAAIFLGEKLTVSRVGAALLGFAGVVVACNPAGLHIGGPELAVLGAATLWALAMIVMRSIPKEDSALAQVLGVNAINVVVMGIASIFVWQAMDLRTFSMVVLTGVLGGAAQYALVHAARLVPAGVLGTVEYSALIWAFVFGWLFWQEIPAAYVYAGALMIVVAGAYIAWAERRRRDTILDTP